MERERHKSVEENAELAERAAHSASGRVAAVVSLFALVFSAFSLYQTTLRKPEVRAFVPPVIYYSVDGFRGPEVFAVPLTMTNNGARGGTVLSANLDVVNLDTKETKRFYSGYLGNKPKEKDKAFAPVSIAGHNSYSDTILFYPVAGGPYRVVTEKGRFAFTLTLQTAVSADLGFVDRWLLGSSTPEPLSFEMVLPYLSHQTADRGDLVRLHNERFQPAGNGEQG